MGYCNHNTRPSQDSVWNKANNVLNAGLCGEQSVSTVLLYFLPAIYLSYVCMYVCLSSASTSHSFSCKKPSLLHQRLARGSLQVSAAFCCH